VTRHTHDDGELTRRAVDYEYVHHHERAEPGLLVVRGVPAEVCALCDEYWFDEDTGFALSRVLEEHAPASGRVDWVEVQAARSAPPIHTDRCCATRQFARAGIQPAHRPGGVAATHLVPIP
jgi:YgiT-type zinc finger domain-containing protein